MGMRSPERRRDGEWTSEAHLPRGGVEGRWVPWACLLGRWRGREEEEEEEEEKGRGGFGGVATVVTGLVVVENKGGMVVCAVGMATHPAENPGGNRGGMELGTDEGMGTGEAIGSDGVGMAGWGDDTAIVGLVTG